MIEDRRGFLALLGLFGSGLLALPLSAPAKADDDGDDHDGDDHGGDDHGGDDDGGDDDSGDDDSGDDEADDGEDDSDDDGEEPDASVDGAVPSAKSGGKLLRPSVKTNFTAG